MPPFFGSIEIVHACTKQSVEHGTSLDLDASLMAVTVLLLPAALDLTELNKFVIS